jgi:hypothetical protein
MNIASQMSDVLLSRPVNLQVISIYQPIRNGLIAMEQIEK